MTELVERTNHYVRLIFSQFGSKLKDIKTQAFQKLNKKLSKLKDFVISKLNFSEKLRSLDARNEFLCSKKQINLGRNSTKRENSRKNEKLKEIMASKLKKIAKTQIFGKSTNLLCPPNCEKKACTITIIYFYVTGSQITIIGGFCYFDYRNWPRNVIS